MSMMHLSDDPIRHVRRHTGAVALIFSGERPIPRSGAEILEIARSSAEEFAEEGSLEIEYEGGSIEYVPRVWGPDAIDEALMHGQFLYKFTIKGTPPEEYRALNPSTYYLYVDFIEGPDFDEGRWIGRLLDEEGTVVSLVPGIEIKQVVTFHIDDRAREEHSRSEMHAHGLGTGEVARLMGAGDPIPSTPKWIVTKSGWKPQGEGCTVCFSCTPRPVVAVA